MGNLRKRQKINSPVSQTTINNLPDEVLELIFDHTEDTLRCGSVCHRWLEITNRNINFMRTASIKISAIGTHPMTVNEMFNINWMRPYRNVKLDSFNFDRFLADEKHVAFFSNIDNLYFHKCVFRNKYTILKLLLCCGEKMDSLEFYSPTLTNPDAGDREKIMLMEQVNLRTIEKCRIHVDTEEVEKIFGIENIFEASFINLGILLWELLDGCPICGSYSCRSELN